MNQDTFSNGWAPAQQLVPGQRLAGYTIKRRLGEAKQKSAVYLAKGPQGETVALKVLPPKIICVHPNVAKRFLREAQAMIDLCHPNLVTCMAAGQDHGCYYLVMEHVVSFSLKELITKMGGKLPEEETISIAIQVARGIGHLHQHNLVHRHIKPDHILIASNGIVKLTGFGLVLPDDAPGLTATGKVAGTPQYMSPEQARGDRDLDIRSDLYSLGIVLYETLTGAVPFDDPKPLAVARMQIESPLTLPRERNPSISQGMEQIIVRLLAKRASQRYASSTDLIEDLKDLQVQETQDNGAVNQASQKLASTQGAIIVTSGTNTPVVKRSHSDRARKVTVNVTSDHLKRTIKILIFLVIILVLLVIGLMALVIFMMCH